MADDPNGAQTKVPSKETKGPSRQDLRERNLQRGFWGTLGGGLLGVLVFAWSASGAGAYRLFAVGLLVAAASAIVGALFGFLFGLPRSIEDVVPANGAKSDDPADGQAGPEGTDAQDTSRPARAPSRSNNNLLEISDWLTKIIVGAGLVGLKDLIDWLGRVSLVVGDGAGLQGAQAQVFGASVIIFFFGWGFLFVYIQTRTIISLVFVATERSFAEVVDRSVRAAVGGSVREAVSEQVRESVGPAVQTASEIGNIMTALYVSPRDAERKARAFLADAANRKEPRAWLYLACALGQQHATAQNDADRQRLRNEAIDALRKALSLDPSLKGQARGFAYVEDPRHLEGDDDLASLREDPELQQLLGPPPG